MLEESSAGLQLSQTPVPSALPSTPLPRTNSRMRTMWREILTLLSWTTSQTFLSARSTPWGWALEKRECSTRREDGLRRLTLPSPSSTLGSWRRSTRIKALQLKSRIYARWLRGACSKTTRSTCSRNTLWMRNPTISLRTSRLRHSCSSSISFVI